MNIPKAIEILAHSLQAPYPGAAGDISDATRLGIQALEFVETAREHLKTVSNYILPCETEE